MYTKTDIQTVPLDLLFEDFPEEVWDFCVQDYFGDLRDDISRENMTMCEYVAKFFEKEFRDYLAERIYP